MANYDEEIEVPLGSVFKDRPPRQAGYVTYVNGSVDTNVAGDYILEYTLIQEDPFDSVSKSKKVTVVDSNGSFDTREPEILLNGSHVVTIPQGTAWIDPGAEAFTKETFESLEVKIALPVDEGSWAYQTPGNYSVVYYAETNGGKVAVAVRTVSIIAVSATASLNGCSKIYFEYPISGDALSYVGQNYTGSGANIVVDAGYSVSGSNYSVEIGVEPEGYEIYLVTEDKVFFTSDPAQTKTYKIFYKVTTQEGYERTSIREVVMMKENETDIAVLSGLEFQKNSADGCADRDPVVTEDELLKNDLEEYGDSVFDDPVLNDTPTDAPDPQSNQALVFLCAGSTAFAGSLFPSTWSSNPGKIPNQIVESWYAPASTRTAWDNFFTVVNGAYMPGETEKTQWTGNGSAIIWQLHKIHSETKVTYSYGYSSGSAPILYSTWEPYYEGGVRVGDIFYGLHGAHIFLTGEGWSAYLSKDSFSIKEILEERRYRGLAPYSFTRITQSLKDMHLAKISASNIPEESVFQDDNKQILNSGTVLHSLPIFRGIDAKIAAGGTGTTDDMISLSWRNIGGVTDVSKYCDYTVQEKLPLYCNTTFDKYQSYDGQNPLSFVYEDSIVGPVPGTIFEITWTDNPNYASPLTSYLFKYSLIHPNQIHEAHTWYLVSVAANRCVYIKSNGHDQKELTIDPDNPTKNLFNGLLASYSFNRLYAPAIYSPSTFSPEAGRKYITNFETADRIPEPNPDGSLSTNFTYYNSLAFGGPTIAWVSPYSANSGSYRNLWQFGSSSSSKNWNLLGDQVEPC